MCWGLALLPPDPKVGEKQVRKEKRRVRIGKQLSRKIRCVVRVGAVELVAISESGEGPEAETNLGMEHCSGAGPERVWVAKSARLLTGVRIGLCNVGTGWEPRDLKPADSLRVCEPSPAKAKLGKLPRRGEAAARHVQRRSRGGKKPGENKSFCKTRLSAKPSAFQGLLCCGFDPIAR